MRQKVTSTASMRRKRCYSVIMTLCALFIILGNGDIPKITIAKASLQLEPEISAESVIEQVLSRQMIAEVVAMHIKQPIQKKGSFETIQMNFHATKIADGVVEFSLVTDDPEYARNFIDTLVKLYIQKSLQQNTRNRADTLEKLDQRNKEIQEKLNAVKEVLENFKKQENTEAFPAKSMETIQLVSGMESKIGDLESQKTELLQTHAPQDPAVQALTDQIVGYKKQVNALEPEINQMPEPEQKLLQLTHDVTLVRQLFLDNTAEINKLTHELIKSDIRTASPAIIERKINWPKIAVGGLLGTIGGLFLCLCFFFIRDNMFFRSVSNLEILKRVTPLPIIASIPRSLLVQQKSKFCGLNNYLVDTKDTVAIALKEVEANITNAMHDARNNIFLFTSESPNQGKSFIASNLSLFSSNNRRTLLIDADMVKGSLHLNFATLMTPGFSDLIAGRATLDQVLANPIDNQLWFIPSGTGSLDDDVLYDHEKLQSLMHIFSKSFDLVIIDYPAMKLEPNDLEILDCVGTIFLVIKQGESASRLKRFFAKYPPKLAEVSVILLNDVK